MGKKSKSKKSKAKQKKSEAPETKSEVPAEAASPLWSTDDVYTLLKGVNEVTLARIENLVKAVNEVTLARMEKQVKDVNEITLKGMEDRHATLERNVTQLMSDTREKLGTIIAAVNALDTTVVRDLLPRMERATHAIKAKTDRLP